MLRVLEDTGFIFDDPYMKAREEKGKGSKVIGVAPMHLPEEIIHAAGGLPIVLQESNEPVSAGYSFMHPILCGLVRTIVDDCIQGKLDFLDGLFVPHTCLQMWAAARKCTGPITFPADLAYPIFILISLITGRGVKLNTRKMQELSLNS